MTKLTELTDDQLIEVSVSYSPYDHQVALSYYFYDWDEAFSFIRLSLSHSFTVQVEINEKKG
jgi:hypothetical protein